MHLLILSMALLGAPAPGAILTVTGALPRTGDMNLAALQALGPETATWKEHQSEHTVVGVRLDKVLNSFGFDPGPMGPDVPKSEKRRGWKMALVASAPDGFEAVFSCAELSAAMGPTRALVVWQEDGKPLDAKAGPIRLVVLTDQEPSRSVHQVSRLEVVDLRRSHSEAAVGSPAGASKPGK